MNKFLKWFLISLGILAVVIIAFSITMFILRGGDRLAVGEFDRLNRGGMIGRVGAIGGMWLGVGSMLLRGLFTLTVLVLAGFGVAYLINRSGHPALVPLAGLACKNCGKPLASEWKACPHCGTVVQEDTSAPPVPAKKTK